MSLLRLEEEEAGTGDKSEVTTLLYKILVVGDVGAGKTSIIKRYVHNVFSDNYKSSISLIHANNSLFSLILRYIGVDFAVKAINMDPQTYVQLQFWDIAGQERFGKMTRVYYKEAVGALLVFDVTSIESLESVEKWKVDIDSKVTRGPAEKPIPVVLLANKCDLVGESGYVKSSSELDSYVKDKNFLAWFSTSAKGNLNISTAVKHLAQHILETTSTAPPPPHKLGFELEEKPKVEQKFRNEMEEDSDGDAALVEHLIDVHYRFHDNVGVWNQITIDKLVHDITNDTTINAISLAKCEDGPDFATLLAGLNASKLLEIQFLVHALYETQLITLCNTLVLPSLVSISIAGSCITDTSIQYIFRLATNNPNLKSFFLSDQTEVSSITPVLEYLRLNSTIRKISLPQSREPVKPEIIHEFYKLRTAPIEICNCGTASNDIFYLYINPMKELLTVNIGPVAHRMIQAEPYNWKQIKEKYVEWRFMKIVVLGNGRIGKTTLANTIHEYFTRKEFSPSTKATESTVGIEINYVDIGGGRVRICDFAGQIEYTVTHQFFLSNEMVLYLVCFNLGASRQEQVDQINSWLGYLNSLLAPTHSRYSTGKWSVILVGTRADEQREHCAMSKLHWQRKFPLLPIFQVASISRTNLDCLRDLVLDVETECTRIMASHCEEIPQYCIDLMKEIKELQTLTVRESVLDGINKQYWNDKELHQWALYHLHCIGEIVQFGDGTICTDPSAISRIMAKFVSPEQVRNSIKKTSGEVHQVSVLAPRQVAAVLQITGKDKFRALKNDLQLMSRFGVCFEIPLPLGSSESLYLFPSLGENGVLRFSMDKKSEAFHYAGVKTTAANGTVFVPGVVCQFIVSLCKELNIYEHEILRVCTTGALFSCAGIMDGQLMIFMHPREPQHILILTMTSNTDILQRILSIFKELIRSNFPRWYTEKKLCSKCIEFQFEYNSQVKGEIFDEEKIHLLHTVSTHRTLTRKDSVKSFEDNLLVPKHLRESCRTHNKIVHDFFINYRVASEGREENYSKSVVQLVYETFSVLKRENGDSVYAFWDKQCLNYGQNWESEFLNAIQHSKIIVLLISMKALEGICKHADTKQDNVLLEYECALIYKAFNRKILPIFIGELLDDGTYRPFSIARVSKLSFVDKPHARNSDTMYLVEELSHSLSDTERRFLSSIPSTINELFKLNGMILPHRGTKKEELNDIANTLLSILNEIAPLPPTPIWHLATPPHAPPPAQLAPTPAVVPVENVPSSALVQNDSDLISRSERLGARVDSLSKTVDERNKTINALLAKLNSETKKAPATSSTTERKQKSNSTATEDLSLMPQMHRLEGKLDAVNKLLENQTQLVTAMLARVSTLQKNKQI